MKPFEVDIYDVMPKYIGFKIDGRLRNTWRAAFGLRLLALVARILQARVEFHCSDGDVIIFEGTDR